jgi:hypothetical protein
MRACGALAWQVLGARFGGDFAGLWGGSLGEHDTDGAEEQGHELRFHGLQSSGSVDLHRSQGLGLVEILQVCGVGVWGSRTQVGLRSKAKNRDSMACRVVALWTFGAGLGV